MKPSDHKIKIDKGVPIPKSFGYGLSHTIEMLKIGESFLYPAVKRSGLYSIAKRFNIKLMIRLEDDANVRIWRIE